MKINKEELLEKGWSEEEIAKLISIKSEAEKNKPYHTSFLEKNLFWGLLLLTITGIFVINIYMLPLLFVLNTFINSIILIILGVCLGSFITIILNDLEWLGFKHHLLALGLIPIISVLNFFFTVGFVHLTLSEGKIILLGLIFSLGLLIPYFSFLFLQKHKKIKKESKEKNKKIGLK